MQWTLFYEKPSFNTQCVLLKRRMHKVDKLEYQVLQLDWQEQYSAVKGSDITDDVTSALVAHQFASHAQTVHLGTETDRVLIDAGIFALHGNVVAAHGKA